ncbi:MAG TPA: hypothetical protein VL527_07320 [Dongiaceae bacterium]|jgi:hypothetical protein|nr:hypothetical protein [Dongiaceae bacterium]
MKPAWSYLLLTALLLGGCVSRKAAQEEARAAYYAGQARGLQAQLSAGHAREAVGDIVAINGPVKVNSLRWTPDLTLIKTIVAAEYTPATPPRRITLIRDGKEIPVDAASLLGGADMPVLPGDIVDLEP